MNSREFSGAGPSRSELKGDVLSAWLDAPQDLARLIGVIHHAIAERQPDLALRFADRAWRLAPESALLCQITMSLQLQCGDPHQALRVFKALPPSAISSGIAALHIDALRLSGAIAEAEEQLEQYLALFATPPDSPLADAASALLEHSDLMGWIGVGPDMKLTGHIRCAEGGNTIVLALTLDGQDEEALMIPAANGWADTSALGNIAAVDGMALVPQGAEGRLLGSCVKIAGNFSLTGAVQIDGRRISGSLRLAWLPHDVPPLLYLNKGGHDEQVPLSADPAEPGTYGFDIPMGALDMLRLSEVWLEVGLPDGRRALLTGAPVALKPIRPYRPARKQLPARTPLMDQTAIVIPIYRGVEETRACIESVLLTVDDDQKVILVNDASPEADMQPMLVAFTDDPRVTLLRNGKNLGFPGAANRGMAAAPAHDIILLNSDTQLFHGWLDRLQAHARAARDIATVTPLSNAGSIASYPGGEENSCDEKTARLLDNLAAHANEGQHVDVPTGVGFCMFIRRACIEQIGGLDETLFAQGYGEENDFCRRASAHGWRHVIAGDVFVWHRNGVSFGDTRRNLMQRNGAVLAARHPEYDDLVRAFHAEQPLAPLRRALDMARLRRETRPIVLLLSLALDGGVGRHVEDRIKALEAQGYAPLLLRPDRDSQRLHISASGALPYPDLAFRFADEGGLFAAMLDALPVHHIEFHHFLGMNQRFVEHCLALDVPVDVYIHDYSWYCPRLSLLGAYGIYCGEPGLAACKSCIRRAGSELHDALAPEALQARSLRWLSRARSVFAPCQDVAARYAAIFPDVTFSVMPWEDSPPAPRAVEHSGAVPHRIAVIGAIGEQKGQNILLACARQAALHDLPLEFVVIGFAEDEEALLRTGKVFVTGRYAPEELPSLLRREAPSGIFLPSVTPETWSYTLSEALATGLPVMAFDIGAIAERLRNGRTPHRLVPLDTSTSRLNEGLMTIAAAEAQEGAPFAAPAAPIAAAPPAPSAPSAQLPLSIRTPAGVSIMRDAEPGLTSSAEFLSLARGLYHFSVAPTGDAARDHPASLPALQIAVAPGQNHNDIECVSSPGAEHMWLCTGQDSVILKVNRDKARVVVILLTAPGLAPLQIDVRKLDGEQGSQAAPQPATVAVQAANGTAPVPMRGATLLRSQIVTHVEYMGDVIGMDQGWTGAPDGGRAIECLTITPIAGIAPASIEYKAVSAAGQETPWIEQGRPCGSRGMAMPLAAFALRQKPLGAPRFTCEYSGKFSSGRIVGPLRDGELCRSPIPSDRLEAIWFHIIDAAGPSAAISPAMSPALSGAAPGGAPEPVTHNARSAGTGFSVFRDIQA